MPMGSRPLKEDFPNQHKDSAAAQQVAGVDELKDPHMAGFWSAILPGTVALNAHLFVPLWSQLFKLAFKAHQSSFIPPGTCTWDSKRNIKSNKLTFLNCQLWVLLRFIAVSLNQTAFEINWEIRSASQLGTKQQVCFLQHCFSSSAFSLHSWQRCFSKCHPHTTRPKRTPREHPRLGKQWRSCGILSYQKTSLNISSLKQPGNREHKENSNSYTACSFIA